VGWTFDTFAMVFWRPDTNSLNAFTMPKTGKCEYPAI
jgi:hypothetical protein